MADDKNFKELVKEVQDLNKSITKQNEGREGQLTDLVEAQNKTTDMVTRKLTKAQKEQLEEDKKHQAVIEKQNKKIDGTGTPPPSSEEEGEKDRSKALENAIGKPLAKFGKGIMDGFKKLGGFFKDKAKGAISVLGNLLKFGIMGAALFAITTFLKSETWAEWKDKLVPALVSAFDSVTEVLKWAKDKIVNGMAAFNTFFGGMFESDGSFKGFKGQIDNLKENFNCLLPAFAGLGTFIVGLGLLLAPKLLGKAAINLAISGLKLAFTGALGLTKFLGNMAGKILSLAATGAKGAGQLILNGIKAVGRALTALKVFMMSTLAPAIRNLVATGVTGAGGAIMGAVGKVGKALTALRLFMTVSLLPAISAMLAGFVPMLVPLLPFVAIAAAVVLVLASIWNAFKDFRCTLEETGSIFEALKVGFASLVANVLGIIPNLIIDFVAWIFKKLGWTEWAAKLKEIDVVSFIKNGLLNIFTKFGAWVGRIYEDYLKPLLAPLLKFFDPAINIIKKVFNFLMDAIQPVIDFIAKIAKKIGGFIKKIASKLNPLTWFGGGDKDKVEDLDDVVSSTTQAQMEVDKAEEPPLITTLPRATVTAANAFPMEGPPVNGGSTNTIINAPTSSVQTTNTNIVRNVVEPDVYFQRQVGFAL